MCISVQPRPYLDPRRSIGATPPLRNYNTRRPAFATLGLPNQQQEAINVALKLGEPWRPVLGMVPTEIHPNCPVSRIAWFMREGWDAPEQLVLADQPIWFSLSGLYFWDASGLPPAALMYIVDNPPRSHWLVRLLRAIGRGIGV